MMSVLLEIHVLQVALIQGLGGARQGANSISSVHSINSHNMSPIRDEESETQ